MQCSRAKELRVGGITFIYTTRVPVRSSFRKSPDFFANPKYARISIVQSVAAASAAPAALNEVLFVHLISTLCIHSIYLAQPA